MVLLTQRIEVLCQLPRIWVDLSSGLWAEDITLGAPDRPSVELAGRSFHPNSVHTHSVLPAVTLTVRQADSLTDHVLGLISYLNFYLGIICCVHT